MRLASTVGLQAGGPGSGCKGPNCGRPHKEEAKRVLSVLNKIPGAEFKLVGSVAKGKERPDSDIDIKAITDAEAFDAKYDHEVFLTKMAKLGYGFAGNTNHGEVWREEEGQHKIDFWFEEDTGEN